MDMFSSISSKTLPFHTHIENNNIEVYGDAYLNAKDDNFIRKINGSTRYLNNPSLIPGSGAEDGEIGVFGAEKYFNGGMDNGGSQRSTNTRKPLTEPSQSLDKLVLAHHHHQHQPPHPMDEPFKPKPWLATPSVGSEASSINSQRPLLKIVRNTTTTTTITNNNNNNYSVEKKNNNKSFLSNTLGYCMCYSCNDKAAVDVKEDVGEISFSNVVTAKASGNNSKLEEETPSFRENPFSFPTGSLKVVHFQEEEVERKSLEVFGSPVMGRHRSKPSSLEKKLAMLSWDHTNNNGGLFYNDDEVNSDCSSDLFEIESLTKQTNNSFQSPTASSCYAPSEASVEWSVVTASALDFEERRPSTVSPPRLVPPPRRVVNLNKDQVVVVQKRRSSSLLGCKSEKAVRVAEDNSNGRKMSAKSNSDHLLVERRKSESSLPVPVKSFEDETKVGGFSFRSQAPPLMPPPHRALALRSLPRPYSPGLSNITFNIQ